jgi:hypothetical protein
MEVATNALRAAGLGEMESVQAYFVLVGFTLSQAGYQARAPLIISGIDASAQSATLAGRA